MLARVVWGLVHLVSATLRFRFVDRSGLFDGSKPGPLIYCTWHNRLAVCLNARQGYSGARNPTAGLAAMVSASKDGAFLAAILECFKVQPVRGSSSRRGPQALLELTTWGERGFDLAITPDGPRGPCYKVQDGVILLAQVTGLPIVPVAFNIPWKFRLKSWDRFQLPLPFSLCEIVFGEPVRVPRSLSDSAREELRETLEQRLKQMSKD